MIDRYFNLAILGWRALLTGTTIVIVGTFALPFWIIGIIASYLGFGE